MWKSNKDRPASGARRSHPFNGSHLRKSRRRRRVGQLGNEVDTASSRRLPLEPQFMLRSRSTSGAKGSVT
jgi:hypothetical protein